MKNACYHIGRTVSGEKHGAGTGQPFPKRMTGFRIQTFHADQYREIIVFLQEGTDGLCYSPNVLLIGFPPRGRITEKIPFIILSGKVFRANSFEPFPQRRPDGPAEWIDYRDAQQRFFPIPSLFHQQLVCFHGAERPVIRPGRVGSPVPMQTEFSQNIERILCSGYKICTPAKPYSGLFQERLHISDFRTICKTWFSLISHNTCCFAHE